MLATSIAVLAAAAVASAQSVVTINVGGPGGAPTFSPNNITASNGTILNFVFTGVPGNHSVTQSTFAAPCTSFEGGFDSGWILVTAATTPPPSWNLTITNDQKPIWFYCKQLVNQHCHAGMVAGVNVQPGPNSLQQFEANAKTAATIQQDEGGNSGTGATASADPFLPAGVSRFVAASATNPPVAAASVSGANGGGGGSSSTTSAASGSTSKSSTGRAVPFGFTSNVLTVFAGMLAGAAMVL
ncbi:hypothetical protein DFH07DRAFT_831388 [Mycena maculata]|uniref:Extracellular serine-rich protein n=1 Tax=Mycena maculata TaxID=230809 RepID=A0AAD7INJ6_9AGAR|nr:hypothetical protein DFH07DRAFT_831388 [Mycena maculata]